MKIIYLFFYYLTLSLFLLCLGTFLAYLTFLIPRAFGFYIFHNNFCKVDNCSTNGFRNQIAIELVILPLLGIICACLFTRRTFKKIFTKKKDNHFYYMLVTYAGSFKLCRLSNDF